MSDTTSALVGRGAELEVLRHTAARVLEGHGATALVSGEAGVGKTRLVSELVASLASEGWWCPVSHGVLLEGGEVPFGGTAELVRSSIGALGEAEVRRLLGRSAVDLAALVPSLVGDAPRVVDRSAVTTAVLTLLERVDSPVCWVLDDLQWLDGATRDLVAYVARVATGTPLLLLGTVRTDPAAPAHLPDGLVELGRTSAVVTLAPLGPEDVAVQARNQAGRPLTGAEVERICAMSDGLPFFVEELVRTEGRLTGSLEAVLQASLRQLSPGARTLLNAAALGEGLLNPTSLRVVTDLEDGFETALAEVRARAVLRTDRESGGLRFRHTLLREAVDNDLLAEERTRLHLRWAAHIEQTLRYDPDNITLLIEHARHRYAVGGPEALPAVHAAAIATNAADDERVGHLWWARAWKLWPAPTSDEEGLARDRVLSSCISSGWAVGDFPGSEQLLQAELAAESQWLRALWLRLHRRLIKRVQQQEFEAAVPPGDVEDTLSMVMAAPRDFRSTEVLVLLAQDCRDTRPEVAFTLLQEAHSRLDTRPSRDVTAWLFELLGWLTVRRGEPDRAVALLQEFVAWAQQNDPGGVLRARTSLAEGLFNAVQYDEAIQVCEENLVRLHDPQLHPQMWSGQNLLLAFVCINTGDWDRAEQCLSEATRGVLDPAMASEWDAAGVQLWARRGDLQRAERHLQQIVNEEAALWEAAARAFCEIEVALAADDAERAGAGYRRLVEVTRPGDTADNLLEGYIFALRATALRGAIDTPMLADAPALLARRDGARVLEVMRAEIEAHRERAADRDTAAGWASVADGWASLMRIWDAAYVRVFEAECALRDIDRTRALTALLEAHGLATRLGADPLRQLCEATARRNRLQGLTTPTTTLGLTPRESEVLRLLISGRTNGEIAGTLFISPKTVSVHVSNILAKLGASNRTEAAALARRHGLIPSA